MGPYEIDGQSKTIGHLARDETGANFIRPLPEAQWHGAAPSQKLVAMPEATLAGSVPILSSMWLLRLSVGI
jgi:hypothetical protein